MFWPFNIVDQARARIARLEKSNEDLRENLRQNANQRDAARDTLRCFLHSFVRWTRPHKPDGSFAKWRNGETYGPGDYANREAFEAAVNGDIKWDRRGRMLLGGKYFRDAPGTNRHNRKKGAK